MIHDHDVDGEPVCRDDPAVDWTESAGIDVRGLLTAGGGTEIGPVSGGPTLSAFDRISGDRDLEPIAQHEDGTALFANVLQMPPMGADQEPETDQCRHGEPETDRCGHEPEGKRDGEQHQLGREDVVPGPNVEGR